MLSPASARNPLTAAINPGLSGHARSRRDVGVMITAPSSRFLQWGAMPVATEEDVYEALEEVIDPELGLDFVSLGLVYDVEIENDEVFITFSLTTPACPIGPQVTEQMREFVSDLEGVEKVHPKMVFDPPWSPEMMSEDAKFALGF